MKTLKTVFLLSVALLLGDTAAAYTINDRTVVLEGHSRSDVYGSWQDVVGDPKDFDVFGVDVSRAGGMITFDLYTNLTLAPITIVTSDGHSYSYYMADFAIDADRDGSFEYGFVLKDHDLWTGLGGEAVNAQGAGSHDVGLYSGVTWRNSSFFNEESLRGSSGGVGYAEKYFDGSAVLDPLVGIDFWGSFTPISLVSSPLGGDGTGGPKYKYSFMVGETDLGLTPTSLSPIIFWAGATCSNDAIYGDPVPEPATMVLLGTGIVGFAVTRRRAKSER